jgi:hypothetical protein
MADDKIDRIPIKTLHQEDGKNELATSPEMKPYLDFVKAVIQGHDTAPELQAIRRLALENDTCGVSLPL